MDWAGAAAKAASLFTQATGSFAEFVASEELRRRVEQLPTRLGSYGVDAFGFDPQYLKRYIGFAAWVYRHYFRCEASGIENIPDGRVLVIANHSGQLPYDAAMVTMAVFLDRERPRFLRSMVERFVPSTPFVSPFLTRCGQILGTPENCRRLLQDEEGILVFPEGVGGLNKTWRERYKLQRFGQGFMRLALETNTPIVPCAVVGAEEQAPSLYNARRVGELFGLPALPLTVTPGFGLWPLPVKYRLHFGAPLRFDGNANDEDPVILRKVAEVKAAIQKAIDEGLTHRTHVFW